VSWTLEVLRLLSLAVAILFFLLARRRYKQATAFLNEALRLGISARSDVKQAEQIREQAIAANHTFAADAARQKKRADEFFAIIEGVEGEAQTWRQMYRRDMASGNAAQSWLFRELGTAVVQGNRYAEELRRRGVMVRDLTVSPELQAVVGELTERTSTQVQVAPGKAAADVVQVWLNPRLKFE
jgi:hypothetical protein